VVSVFAVVFAVSVILLVAFVAGEIAARKGRPFWLYFAAGLIVGPLAVLGALLLPRNRRFAPRHQSGPAREPF
jgi:Kef-type K+ transport system membrane component KefB